MFRLSRILVCKYDWINQYPTVRTVKGTENAMYTQKSCAILISDVAVLNVKKFIPNSV